METNPMQIKRMGANGPEVIPWKVWLVSLPVNLAVPGLTTYAYKDQDAKVWHVIEHASGLSLGKGKKRAEASERATKNIFTFQEKMKSLISVAISKNGIANA